MVPQKILPYASWPQADQAAWQSAIADDDVFDGRGPAAHWSEGSRRPTLFGYGRWLGWLAREHGDDLGLAPPDRVTSERIGAYIAHLRSEMSASGTCNYVKNLYDAIRAMTPERDWTWLRTIKERLARNSGPALKGNRVVFSDQLLDLGLILMEQAEADLDTADSAAALQYRDGLIIALLALMPLRRRNIAMIRIGGHLIDVGGRYVVAFDAEETKNRQPLEFEVPGVLAPYLDGYLQDIRPCIGDAPHHDYLWPSMKGGGLSGDRIYNIVRNRTSSAFGNGLSIHLFRDCAATTLATQSPRHALAARDLLGHADFRTTEAHYIQAQTLQAGRTFQSILEHGRAAVLAPDHEGDD